jgi:hypothetical protein
MMPALSDWLGGACLAVIVAGLLYAPLVFG